MDTDHKKYFEYLQRRSFLARLYMKYFLYPKLNKYLPGKTLDVGCGVGHFLRFRDNITGIDVNEYNIQYLVSSGFQAKLITNSSFPLDTNEFDSVIMDNVIEHIEDPESTLQEIRRVLKPGGLVVIGVPGQKGYVSDSDHKVFYNENALVMLLQKHGFTNQNNFYTPFKSDFLDRSMRQYCLYGVFTTN